MQLELSDQEIETIKYELTMASWRHTDIMLRTTDREAAHGHRVLIKRCDDLIERLKKLQSEKAGGSNG